MYLCCVHVYVGEGNAFLGDQDSCGRGARVGREETEPSDDTSSINSYVLTQDLLTLDTSKQLLPESDNGGIHAPAK